MNNEKNLKLYTSGEFAKLAGINKRTLHYYNDIGLFRPKLIGENGYHYYAESQFTSLELILILRKIGISVKEIQDYLYGKQNDNFATILDKQKKLIEQSIDKLSAIENFLNVKSQRIELALKAKHGDISLVTLPERKIVLSEPFSNADNIVKTQITTRFSLRLKKLFSLYDNFGTRISVDSLESKRYDCDDCYFAYCPNSSQEFDEILPEGLYIQGFSIGSWDKLPALYQKIFEFAANHNLALCGYSYEEGLNEMSLANMGFENLATMDDYITRITIRVKEK